MSDVRDGKLPCRAEHEARMRSLDRDAFTAAVRGAAAGTLLLLAAGSPLVWFVVELRSRL